MVQESAPTLERLAALVARDNVSFLEVGSYVGQSTSIFCRELAKFKNTTITCVDIWEPDNFGVDDTLEIFKENTQEYSGIINVIRRDSREAYKDLPDRFYDLVYIDGNHFYEYAKQDIKNYFSKCKNIYCGHDCEMRYEDLPSYLFEDMEVEFPSFKYGEKFEQCPFDGIHCGVVKAVHELLPVYHIENRVWFCHLPAIHPQSFANRKPWKIIRKYKPR